VHESIVFSFFGATCIVHKVAILLHDYSGIYAPPSTPRLYAIHHTILAITILCKGQLDVLIHFEFDFIVCVSLFQFLRYDVSRSFPDLANFIRVYIYLFHMYICSYILPSWLFAMYTHILFLLLSRRREHLHTRALQIRAELSTHIHRETGPHEAAEGRPAECVCEAESEQEFVLFACPVFSFWDTMCRAGIRTRPNLLRLHIIDTQIY